MADKARAAEKPGKYMSVKEAAEFSVSSEPTIRRLLTKKKLTRFKFGARTLLLRSEVENLVRRAG